MLARVIQEVISGIWLIDPQRAQGYFPIIANYLKGNGINMESDESDGSINKSSLPYFIDRQSGAKKTISSTWDMSSIREEDIPEGAVIVLPVSGAISKYNYCGTPGSNSISNFLKRIDGMKNASGVVMVYDSPGGSAAGTRNLSETIGSMKKPVVAYIDELCASAAYWAASRSDRIIANHSTAEIGSIGTYCSFHDLRKWKEFEGIQWHEVYATKSIAKNLSFKEALEGKYDKLRKEIDVINEAFIEGVKAGRPGVNEIVFTGILPFAPEALELGLIDEIGGIELAFDAVEKLRNSKSTNQNNDMSIFSSNKKYKVSEEIQAVLSLEDDKDVELSQEHLDKISLDLKTQGDKIKANDQVVADLKEAHQKEIDAKDKTIADNKTAADKAAADLKEKETTIKTLENQIAKRAGVELPHPELKETDEIEKENKEVSPEQKKMEELQDTMNTARELSELTD
jgi:ClpP class serine protease